MWNQLLDRSLHRLIGVGRLHVVDTSGTRRTYGPGGTPEVSVHIHDRGLPRKLLANPELALGEAYMDARLTIAGDDLPDLLALLLMNRDAGRSTAALSASRLLRRRLRHMAQYNPLARAQGNVAHHYDLSRRLYELFLDLDMNYSCAYFRSSRDSLEKAQAQKKTHVAAKLRLAPGMRVLDIGCGWGGVALTLARDYGVRVVGVTLSTEQHRLARERVRQAGLEDRVDIRLADYRTVTESFDRVVSIGMFEHVGAPHFREYFSHVRDRLTEDGVALIHTIGRRTPPGASSPWMAKYIFPGGYVPALSEVMAAIERERLWATDIEVLRLHYARTLLEWRRRFEANIDEVRELYDDRFCRMWRYYLVASEMTFRHLDHVVFQIQLTRRQDAVPLTRDYLYHDHD
ncbi:class I SAM-dependent methyltransferase [Tropicimonas sp. IMCC6043]|nr:cyclopropane-fatty-acyl-phospholipid synthase family protein [Tropicimonas sp. IMCC6043]RYH06717.1 class I SAM-dependent methyltransferase [Tropicimonas sp. IMCC6043]